MGKHYKALETIISFLRGLTASTRYNNTRSSLYKDATNSSWVSVFIKSLYLYCAFTLEMLSFTSEIMMSLPGRNWHTLLGKKRYRMSGAAVTISEIFDLNISCLGSLELQFLSPQYWVNVGNCVTFFSFLGYFIYQKIFWGEKQPG